MTELLPKPNRADYRGENGHECYLIDDRDYYKRLAEFAMKQLEDTKLLTCHACAPCIRIDKHIDKALSTIKQGEHHE